MLKLQASTCKSLFHSQRHGKNTIFKYKIFFIVIFQGLLTCFQFCLLLCFFPRTEQGTPDVFDDYFDEEVKVKERYFCYSKTNNVLKVVDISQKVAIEACVSSSGSLLDKIDRATKKCLGDDRTFDWEDFDDINTVELPDLNPSMVEFNVELQGSDTDDNGLTIKMENAEACFYQDLGWLNNKGDNVIKDAIIEDLDNLKDNYIKQTFNRDINLCVNWNGKFGPARKRRSAEDPAEEVNFIYDLT